MRVFDKTLSEYFAFQWTMMVLILLVGFIRLLSSLAGISDSVVK